MGQISDTYLKKIFKIIYNHVIGSNPSFDISELFDDSNVYEDIYEIIASFGMNIIVAFGFYLDWKGHKQNKL
jgi:hypothetical protein